MPVVSYVGAFDEQYPRNQIIRAGLAAQGWQVRSVPLNKRLNTLRKLPLLWRAMQQEAAFCDLFILAEFNQLLVPFALLFGRLLRKPVAVDYLVGLYDAGVQDRATTASGSWRARLFRLIDRWNCAQADLIFTDTAAHRTALQAIVGPVADRLQVVPVGVYDEWWQPGAPPPVRADDRRLVLFFGSYIPFHGVDVILQAAALLRDEASIHFELIGRGQTHAVMRDLAAELALEHVTFVDPLPQQALVTRVQAADVCLGVFGDRAKTDYVVPNKLYQYMALGKPVITGEAAALRECFTPGEHLATVPPGDAAALAAAIRELIRDPARQDTIGQNALAAVQAQFTPEHVAAELIVLLEDLL